jgi:hypothetical protein
MASWQSKSAMLVEIKHAEIALFAENLFASLTRKPKRLTVKWCFVVQNTRKEDKSYVAGSLADSSVASIRVWLRSQGSILGGTSLARTTPGRFLHPITLVKGVTS